MHKIVVNTVRPSVRQWTADKAKRKGKICAMWPLRMFEISYCCDRPWMLPHTNIWFLCGVTNTAFRTRVPYMLLWCHSFLGCQCCKTVFRPRLCIGISVIWVVNVVGLGETENVQSHWVVKILCFVHFIFVVLFSLHGVSCRIYARCRRYATMFRMFVCGWMSARYSLPLFRLTYTFFLLALSR